MKSTWSYILAWLAAVALAIGLALASPNEASVMGQLPAFMSRTLLNQPVAVHDGQPSGRMLALINFQRGQRSQIESWIAGLNLKNDPSIAWVRMPVINDTGDSKARDAAQNRLLDHYTAETDRAKLVPVFTDRASFARAAGLNGVDQVYAVVINRNGDVLARVEGGFDPEKAQSLRETLKAHDL
jgi:hypothetical protein